MEFTTGLGLMRRIFLFITVFFSFQVAVFGVTYSTRPTANGLWTTTSNWSTTYPGCCNLSNNNNDIYNIYGRINVGTLSTNQDLTVSKGLLSIEDTLIIYGNLNVGNNGSLYLSNGSVLIVYGNVSVDNQVTIAANSYFVIMGNFTKTGAANQGSFTSDDQPSNVYIGGTINVPGTWASTGGNDVLNCSLSEVHDSSNCNYGNPIDLQDSPIADFVNKNCTDIPIITTITSNSPVLSGATINLSANGNPGTGTWPVTYNWQGPLGYLATGSNPTRAAATLGMSGFYNLTLINNEKCAAEDSTYVEVLSNDCCVGSSYVSRDNYTGDWEDEGSWATPNEAWRPLPPPTNPMNTQTLCINGTITVNGDLTINGGNQKICDTLIITGNLTVQSYSLNITSTGVLIVLGNFTGISGSLQNSGRVVLVGEVNNPNSNSVTNTGSIYVFDDDPFIEGFTPTGDENTLETNDPTLFDMVAGLLCGSGMNGGFISDNQFICDGDDVAEFTSTVDASPGAVTYQWYLSTDSNIPASGTWVLIGGANSATYDSGGLTTSTYFYRKATNSSGCSSLSNVLTVIVYRIPETGPVYYFPN